MIGAAVRRDTTAAPARRVHAVVPTPIGAITLVMNDEVLSGLYFEQHRYPPRDGLGTPDPTPFAAIISQLERYFAGTLKSFDLTVALRGTAFQLEVWAALLDVEHGTTTTYGAIAAHIGRPRAVRAVGLAVGHNPVSIVVPCHRVVGGDGRLTGYAGGLDRKAHLLALERG